MYPKSLKTLMESLQKLPGVGEKTAERLGLFIVSDMSLEDSKDFSKAILEAKDKIKPCPISFVLTEDEISPILKDDSRDKETLMILSDSKDVYMMEKMQTYNGQYHVLGGLIDFSRGITDKDLYIDELIERVNKNNFKEIIVATNATVEGELTAEYLKSLFESNAITLTRLAYGLPVGSDLKYADILTLIRAVENRRKF